MIVQVIDRSSLTKQEELQSRSDGIIQENPRLTHSIQWMLYTFSDVLLSSLSLHSFYPCKKPGKIMELDDSTFFTTTLQLEVNDITIETVTCVDINHYSDKFDVQEPDQPDQPDQLDQPDQEDNVVMMGNSYLVVVNGTRMLLSKEEYLKEKEKKQEKKNEEAVEDQSVLSLTSVQNLNEIDLAHLYHSPYYLIVGSSNAYIQLIRSLVLNKQIAVFQDTSLWYLVPFTSTVSYLFTSDPSTILHMKEKTDCSSLLQQNNNELFFYWRFGRKLYEEY